MAQKQLRKSEIRELNVQLKRYGLELSKKDDVVKKDDFLEIDGKIEFFFFEDKVLPLLNTPYCDKLKKITVDMGAIKFVTSGAEVMRPGITDIDDDIEEGEPVAIQDEKNKKVIAIGISKLSTAALKDSTSGKVIRNIHHVGDKYWNH